MNQDIKLSIITICFNSERYIEQTILSVINQSYTNIEYIIIDGGSTDGTLDIIKRYKTKITKWVSESDKGISDAFNKGIKMATGDYIQMLNAGDFFIDNFILSNNILQIDSDVVTFKSSYIGTNNTIPRKFHKNVNKESLRAHISHQATFIAKYIYEEYGGYNIQYKVRMDYEFFLRILSVVRIKYIDEIIVKYDNSGISSNKPFRFTIEGIVAEYFYLNYSYIKFLSMIIYKPIFNSMKSNIKKIVYK